MKNLPLLTERENGVRQLVLKGWTTKAIAGELGLTESAVQKHRENMRRKTGISETISADMFSDAEVDPKALMNEMRKLLHKIGHDIAFAVSQGSLEPRPRRLLSLLQDEIKEAARELRPE